MRALITGASGGIGRDLAIVLAREGYELVLVARSGDKLEALRRELPTAAEVIVLDLSLPESCRLLYEKLRGKPLDLLVNNAGYGIFGLMSENDTARELNMLDLNIRALHELTSLYLKDFVAAGRGQILNVASIAGFMPGPMMAAYYASKAYVFRLSVALAEELRRQHSPVRVSVLCPGPVKTGFNQRAGAAFLINGKDSRDVAEYTVRQLIRGKTVIVPGFLMKLSRLAIKPLPSRVAAWVGLTIQRKRRSAR